MSILSLWTGSSRRGNAAEQKENSKSAEPTSGLSPSLDITTREGFEQVYRRYAQRLLSAAYNQLRDKAEAENIVHDVFGKLWERRDEVVVNSSIENYLTRAVKLAIFSYLRVQLGRKKIDAQINGNIGQQDNSVEESIRFNELMAETNKLTSQIPPRRQQIYRLSTEQLMTNREIASVMDISEKTVDSQLTKALKFLRSNLQKYISRS
ncbi:MAG: RNA polymerase sigma-70 factor [Bacteroidota bacterium]